VNATGQNHNLLHAIFDDLKIARLDQNIQRPKGYYIRSCAD